ncbi:MAG TPA: hypothetical protein VHC22_04725 [Pirellulales bacterium]|nr:hypothetical protein [Pirellulales bacterium]
MSASVAASEVLNREFLEIRARVLEVAAALDRIDRASGSVKTDQRCGRIDRALAALAQSGPGRAERVQMIFSLPYQEDWQSEFAIEQRR